MKHEVQIVVEAAGVSPLAPPAKGRWANRWEVFGDQGDAYIVSRDHAGAFGCSCPHWKFRRARCKHIERLARWLAATAYWVEVWTGRKWRRDAAWADLPTTVKMAQRTRRLTHRSVRVAEVHR